MAVAGIGRVQYFTSTGSFLGKWGSRGSGNGEFEGGFGVGVPLYECVYVADDGNHRIQRFTSSGSFLGKWGSHGKGKGQFEGPSDVAVNRRAGNVYVADSWNCRIQYFRWSEPAVSPTSLGHVRALFK